MDDIIIGQVGVLVFGIAIAAVFIATIASNPEKERASRKEESSTDSVRIAGETHS
jgi:hypothetical protein